MIENRRILYPYFSLALFSVALYGQTPVFSLLGLLGVLLISLITMFICFRLTSNLFDKSNGERYVVLLFFSIVYFACSILNVNIIFSRLSIIFYAIIYVACVFWNEFFYYKNTIGFISCLFFMLVVIISVLYLNNNIGFFSPDSYGYYDVSKTFFDDFGVLKTIRQYSIQTPYNTSFPYLYPACIFIVNTLAGLGMYSGVLVNVLLVIVTVAILFRGSKEYTGSLYPGVILSGLLLVNREYLEEIIAARSIPLAICLICSFALFIKRFQSNKYVKIIDFFLIGLFAGAYLSTRQDGLPLIPYTLVIILIFGNKKIIASLLFIAGTITTYLPQALYSFAKFGKPFISDNSGTFLKVNSYNWIMLPGEAKTLFTSPDEWLTSFLHKIINVFISLFKCSYIGDILIIFLLILVIVSLAKKKVRLRNIKELVVVFLFYAGKTAMYMLVGYTDIRYHIETVLMISFVLIYTVYKNNLLNSTFAFQKLS